MIPVLKEMHKVSLSHLVVPETKEVLGAAGEIDEGVGLSQMAAGTK